MDDAGSDQKLEVNLAYDGNRFVGTYNAKAISGKGVLGKGVDGLLGFLERVFDDSPNPIRAVNFVSRGYHVSNPFGLMPPIPRAPQELLETAAVEARERYVGIEFRVM
ncbi:hypothetical protein COV17_00080 [Candidatus Woesearchaeota archaeon CG10_big_fil_rev_8_21_14_0_10_36_11]|nr:MAG: hypothetical protein COV17_00080 [Candidatus Woesearchaeota archaeon CG10_big_fil_rev_8_21_14_0_10_36_11]